jgi:hypothetical protein
MRIGRSVSGRGIFADACLVLAANAKTRAWLDREPRIALGGETTNANIQAEPGVGRRVPIIRRCCATFDVSGNSSSPQFELVNGVASQHMFVRRRTAAQTRGLLSDSSFTDRQPANAAPDVDVNRRSRGAGAMATGRLFIDNRSRRPGADCAAVGRIHRAVCTTRRR